MPKIIRFIYFLCFCILNNASGQIKFTARLLPDEIGKEESTVLKLTVENAEDIGKIIPPPSKGFTIVGGPNQESSTRIFNNVVKKSFSVSYYIQPNKTGAITIGSATAIVNGATIHSNTVVLHVSNSGTGGNSGSVVSPSPFMRMDEFLNRVNPINDNILKRGESVEEKIQKNMFVVAEVNKNSCFVGEPVVVEYKLYTRLKSESVLTKNPSFNGFSVIDLQRPDNSNYTQEKISGKAYNVYTIRKAQLYPLQSGDIEIEKMELENTIHFIKEDYAKQRQHFLDDFFSDFTETLLPPEAMEDHKVVLQSKPVFIHVVPLPGVNKPAGFKGAVGNFSLTASLTKKSFATDESAKLTVVLNGEGNLHLITPPQISWPKGIEAYEPSITNETTKLLIPTSGKVIYEYSIIADTTGHYELPPIVFSFFDPKTSTYKSTTTEALSFTVTKGTNKKAAIIVPENDKEHFFNRLFANRIWLVITLAILILGSLTFWLWKERKKEVNKAKATRISPVVISEQKAKESFSIRAWLEKLEIHASDSPEQFCLLLNQGLKKYFADFLNCNETELNKKAILEKLQAKNLPKSTIEETEQLMDNIEWQLYSPASDHQKNSIVLEKIKQLIQSFSNA